MLPVYPSLEKQFDRVVHAAAAAGLEEVASRTAQRAAGLDQPFTLYVLGARNAGKSTVIDHLTGANIAAIRGDGPSWINVYRRRRGRTEFAEVHYAGSPEHSEIIPIERARELVASPHCNDDERTIERIVWHLNVRALHRHLALVELPPESVATVDQWDADALLWVVRADQRYDRSAADWSTCLEQDRSPFIPATCVVTRMDQLKPSEWLSRLRSARNEVGSSFEHVVPFAIDADDRDSAIAVSPLRKSILTWISDGAQQARYKKLRCFVTHSRRTVARSLEDMMETLLDASARFEVFERALPGRVDQEVGAMAHHIDSFVSLLSGAYAAYGERLENEPNPQNVRPFVPPVSAGVLFSRLGSHLNDLARSLGTAVSWTLNERAPHRANPAGFTDMVCAALPDPPVALLDRLTRLPAGAYPREAGIFDGEGGLPAQAPVDAALFAPSTKAAERLGRTVRTAINQWLSAARVVVADAATRIAAEAFTERFGCEPSQLRDRIANLEDQYSRLMCDEPRTLILQHPAATSKPSVVGQPMTAA